METKRKSIFAVVITFIWTLVTVLGIGWVNRNILPNVSGALWLVVVILPWWPMLLATAFFMRRNGEGLKDIGFTKEKLGAQILLGFPVAAITLLVFIILPELLFNIRMGFTMEFNLLNLITELIYMLLGVALVEEIIFRGHLFKKLLDIKDNKWFAILVSSVLFGLFHMFNFNPLQIVITTIMGIVWCLLREKIKHCTLLTLIIAHALHNALIPLVIGLFFSA